LIDAIGVAQPLGQQLDALERRASNETGLDNAIADATAAIRAWRSTAMDADALSRRLLRAQAHLPLVWLLCRDPSMPDEEVIRCIAMIFSGELPSPISIRAKWTLTPSGTMRGEGTTLRRQC
jgi:hypothetical protein